MSIARKEKMGRRALDQTVLFLVGLYFVMKPFYLWKSGLPQISDFLILFSFLLFTMKWGFVLRYPKGNRILFMVGTVFFLYVVLLNVVWFVVLDFDTDFIQSALFFTFNIGVMLYFTMLYHRYKEVLIRVVYRGALASVIIQGTIFMARGGFQGGRNLGTFNNPNQLGYYGLLIFGFLIFTSQRIRKTSSFIFLTGVTASIVLTMTSLSKAAMIAYAILVLGFLILPSQNRKLKRKVNAIILLVFLGVLMVVSYRPQLFSNNQLVTEVQGRVSRIGKDNDDSLAVRGYDRILGYPQYWIFGAGEGRYDRFNNATFEFHSTLGTVQVAYGILGTLQFLFILYYVLKKNGFRGWYIIACILIYGITHNGLRNSMLWILLSLFTTGAALPSMKKDTVPISVAKTKRAVYPTLVAIPQNSAAAIRVPMARQTARPVQAAVPKKPVIAQNHTSSYRIGKVHLVLPARSWEGRGGRRARWVMDMDLALNAHTKSSPEEGSGSLQTGKESIW